MRNAEGITDPGDSDSSSAMKEENHHVTQTLNYVDAIAHLPPGGTLILTDVPWEEYEQLLADLGEGYAVRISYDQGRLEIMSPSTIHEMYKELLQNIALLMAREVGLSFESRGSMTFKQEWPAQGAEPDTCFYVQNAARIIGKRQIDLKGDPPPDVVVEIDVSHESTRKFKFYATLGVPELWHYDEQRAAIYLLADQFYDEAPASKAFPMLTSDALTQFLEISKTEGQTRALQLFDEWLRKQRS
jgi:Uma2 family endonuclease